MRMPNACGQVLQLCAACQLPIVGVHFQSSLFGVPDQTWLCKHCSDREEDAIATAGTNHIPGLRATYQRES